MGIRYIESRYSDIEIVCHLDNDTFMLNTHFIDTAIEVFQEDYVALGEVYNIQDYNKGNFSEITDYDTMNIRINTICMAIDVTKREKHHIPFYDIENYTDYDKKYLGSDDGCGFYNYCKDKGFKIANYKDYSRYQFAKFENIFHNVVTNSFYHLGGYARGSFYKHGDNSVIRLSNTFLEKKFNALRMSSYLGGYNDDLLLLLDNNFKSNFESVDINYNYDFHKFLNNEGE